MLLTVDIGNTNIKIGAWEYDQLAFISTLQTNPLATSDEYAGKLVSLFRLENFNNTQFDGAIVSSVVPQVTQKVAQAIQRVIQVAQVHIISPGMKTGLNIKIDDPATLGSDIVCAGVAAIENYPLPCLILSLGTATVLFAVNDKKEYIGGSIGPGVSGSLNALSSGTAQLPYISLDQPGPTIGTNTRESMLSGMVYGFASMVDGMIVRMCTELGVEKVTVVASGGLADSIIPYCKEEIIINNTLVLDGLRLIFKKNNPDII